jgi:uncharacterized protein YidB (DUF937 family)
MSVFDRVLGELAGTMPGTTTQTQRVLGSLFTGVPGGMNSSGVGGVQGLLARFDAAGLGHIMESWLGNGPNQPVTPDQLCKVLGNDQVLLLAKQTGLRPHELLQQLSLMLPDFMARLQRHGGVPNQPPPGQRGV